MPRKQNVTMDSVASKREFRAHQNAYNPHGAMFWKNVWAQGAYKKNDVVLDIPYTMIANQDTEERAAPQPLGNPEWALPDAPVWANYQNTSIVYSGHFYTFSEPLEIRALRIWVPELTGTTNYRAVIILNPNSANPIYKTFEEPVLNLNDWTVLGTDVRLLLAGDELLIYLDSLNSGGETTWAYNWEMQGSSNNTTPLDGFWNTNVQRSLLRINWFDAEAIPVDHQLELQVVPDTIFEISQVGTPENYIWYRVQGAYTEGVDWTEYAVTIADIGNDGPVVTLPCQIRAVQPIADPTKFVGIVGHWTANQPVWGTVESFLAYDGVDQGAAVDNAYGIDISVQRLSISADWDLVAKSSG